MNNLVSLPTSKAPSRAVEAGHSAAILFFTGVRYYRVEEAPLVPIKVKRPTRKPSQAVRSEMQA